MPRFAALFSAVLTQAADLQQLVSAMEAGFSLSTASGTQLDLLGESFGITRSLNLSDTDYRSLILSTLRLWRWDGTNETAPDAGVTPS